MFAWKLGKKNSVHHLSGERATESGAASGASGASSKVPPRIHKVTGFLWRHSPSLLLSFVFCFFLFFFGFWFCCCCCCCCSSFFFWFSFLGSLFVVVVFASLFVSLLFFFLAALVGKLVTQRPATRPTTNQKLGTENSVHFPSPPNPPISEINSNQTVKNPVKPSKTQ